MALRGFRLTRGGHVVIRLDGAEREVLRDLVEQLRALVQPADGPDTGESDPLALLVGIDPAATTPTDPAMLRLFPDAYGDDEPEATAEFRRFTERSLREGKLANAERVVSSLEGSGDRLVLTPDDVQSWLGALNDVRLTIGTRLGITEDIEERPPFGANEAELMAYDLYHWLTFLQETLVRAAMGLRPPDVP